MDKVDGLAKKMETIDLYSNLNNKIQFLKEDSYLTMEQKKTEYLAHCTKILKRRDYEKICNEADEYFGVSNDTDEEAFQKVLALSLQKKKSNSTTSTPSSSRPSTPKTNESSIIDSPLGIPRSDSPSRIPRTDSPPGIPSAYSSPTSSRYSSPANSRSSSPLSPRRFDPERMRQDKLEAFTEYLNNYDHTPDIRDGSRKNATILKSHAKGFLKTIKGLLKYNPNDQMLLQLQDLFQIFIGVLVNDPKFHELEKETVEVLSHFVKKLEELPPSYTN